MRYNYVVLRNDLKPYVYDYAYKECNETGFSLYFNFCDVGFWFGFLYRICFGCRTRKYSPTFIKKIWVLFWVFYLQQLIKGKGLQNRRLCFVLSPYFCEMEKIGLSYLLRKKFKNSRIVYFFTDLVSKTPYMQYLLENCRKDIDLIYSFDCGDAEKYGLKLHNIPYSDLSGLFPNSEIKYDICFVGAAKNRLDEILSAYKSLRDQGLKCGFFIVGVPKEKQLYADEINYCNNIPYKENLKIVSESKCILEIMQKGGTGNTVRVDEAISLDKLLISNNPMLTNNDLYEPKYMKVFDDIGNFNAKEFIDSIKEIHYSNKEKMYPSAFLKQIEKDLSELEQSKNHD